MSTWPTRLPFWSSSAADDVARPTLEALTLARSLGTPVAVWLGGAPVRRRRGGAG